MVGRYMKYNNIEFPFINKEVEIDQNCTSISNANTSWAETLFALPKASLTTDEFEEMSAFCSVCIMNYEILNGGITQYFDNRYHEFEGPLNSDDVAHLDKNAQVKMLKKLETFGREVFPEHVSDNAKLADFIFEFDQQTYEDYKEAELNHEIDWNRYEDFDDAHYEIADYLSLLLEAYACYLHTSIIRRQE